MTEKELLIFEMIDDGYSLNEMANCLRLSARQVHQKIQKLISEGYFISPIYYDDGNIRYGFEEDTVTVFYRKTESEEYLAEHSLQSIDCLFLWTGVPKARSSQDSF